MIGVIDRCLFLEIYVEEITAKQDRLIDTEVNGKLERAYLVAVESNDADTMWSVEDSVSELGILARTAGAEVVGTLIQRLPHPDGQTYVGKGRAQDLATWKNSWMLTS